MKTINETIGVISYIPANGTTPIQAARTALSMAKRYNTEIALRFNGLYVLVFRDMTVNSTERALNNKLSAETDAPQYLWFQCVRDAKEIRTTAQMEINRSHENALEIDKNTGGRG